MEFLDALASKALPKHDGTTHFQTARLWRRDTGKTRYRRQLVEHRIPEIVIALRVVLGEQGDQAADFRQHVLKRQLSGRRQQFRAQFVGFARETGIESEPRDDL